MSKAKGNTDDESTHSKNTTLVCYLKGEAQDWRERLAELSGNTKWTEYTAEKKDYFFINLIDGDDRIYLSDYTDIRELDDIAHRIRCDRKVKKDYQRGRHEVSGHFFNGIEDEIPDSIGDRLNRAYMTPRYRDDTLNTFIKSTVSVEEKMGLLKEKSEATQGDQWEDRDAEMAAIQVTVDAEELTWAEMAKFNNDVMPVVALWCETHPWVSQVRIRECEIKKTEQGDCHNVF
jgi:hypothetical protein